MKVIASRLAALVIMICPYMLYASDVGYTHSQSSSSKSDRVSATYSIDKQNKISVSYNQSKDTTGTVVDDQSNSLKLGYKHKFEEGNSLAVDYKKTDETYYFEGSSLALKGGIILFDFSDSQEHTCKTKLNLKGDFAQKQYSKNTKESIDVRAYTAGIDQDLPYGFAVGFDHTTHNYGSTSTQTSNALNGRTILNTDISSYISNLSKNSTSAYFEYDADSWTLGFSYSVDNPYLSNGTKSSLSEIYTDIQFGDHWSISGSFSRGKTEGSTTSSDTSSLGLSYSF